MTSPTCTHVNSYWRVHHVNTRMDIECVFVCMMCVWVCVCFVMFIAIWKHMYTREYTSIHPIKAPHVNSYEELLWDGEDSFPLPESCVVFRFLPLTSGLMVAVT
jgi:hypothetical protein